jgi:hypothetical protein
MSLPDFPETVTRIGFGAIVGLVAGFIFVVGTASFYANSAGAFVIVVGLSVAACSFLGWRFGDRFFQSLHKWIRWF